MPVRTRRLAEAIVVTVGSSAVTSLFTVDENRVAIIKEIVWSQTAGSVSTTIYFYVDTAGANTLQVGFSGTAANDSPIVIPRWLVLQEGDQLLMAQSSGRTINVYVSGTLLNGDPA